MIKQSKPKPKKKRAKAKKTAKPRQANGIDQLIEAEPIESPVVHVPGEGPRGKGGRKSPYNKELHCQLVAQLAMDGATDTELAEACGVSMRSYYRWRALHQEFRQSCMLGKEACDDRVERTLYQRAVGYDVDAVKFHAHEGQVTVTHYKEHVQPDTGAQKHWLGNRRRDEWGRGIGDVPQGPVQSLDDDRTRRELARRLVYLLETLVIKRQETKELVVIKS